MFFPFFTMVNSFTGMSDDGLSLKTHWNYEGSSWFISIFVACPCCLFNSLDCWFQSIVVGLTLFFLFLSIPYLFCSISLQTPHSQCHQWLPAEPPKRWDLIGVSTMENLHMERCNCTERVGKPLLTIICVDLCCIWTPCYCSQFLGELSCPFQRDLHTQCRESWMMNCWSDLW